MSDENRSLVESNRDSLASFIPTPESFIPYLVDPLNSRLLHSIAIVSIPTDQIPSTALQAPEHTFTVADELDISPPAIEANFESPSFVPAGFLLWLLSVVTVFTFPAIIALPYILVRYRGVSNATAAMTTDPTVLLLTVIGVIPAHLITFAAAWAVVTKWRTRPFWRTLGWSFSPRWGFWPSAGLAITLYFIGAILTKLIGGEPTDIDILVNSTFAVRVLLAVVATASGPLVEEIVYRGVLYPTLQRRIGMAWAVALVSFLFFFVHVYQYRKSLGVITVILILSVSLTLVRALTGRLLPCFIIHLVFNGIISILIVVQPFLEHVKQGAEPKTSLVMLWRMTRLFIHTYGL